MKPAPTARDRQRARRPRSLPTGSRDEAFRRALRLFRSQTNPRASARQAYPLARALRMTLLHSPVKRGDPAIAGRLIEYRIAPGGECESLRVAFLLDFESVKARAQHKQELVAQHLSGGAQFAGIAVPLAQEPRLAVGPAVAKARKHQRDRRKPVEIWQEIVEIAIVRPDHPELGRLRQHPFGVFEESRGRNQHATPLRQFGSVRQVNENVGRNLAVLNEWHRPAP